MTEWEIEEESGQQYIDCLGGRFWLSNDIGDIHQLVKVTVDAAGPNASRPTRFATELRAKDWVEYLIEKEEAKIYTITQSV